MNLEIFEMVDDLMGVVLVSDGVVGVDVVDENVEEWEDVLDGGELWWEE